MAIVGLGGEKLWLCPSLNDNPHDISGNGNNGTYNGGMGTVADVSKGGKRAYSFDGVDDYIDLTTSNVASSQNLNSFSLWINPDSINSVAVIINAGNASNGDRFINLGINSTQNILCGRSNDWLVAGNHSTSNWYHLCVISNGTTISLYKDGLLIGSRTDATVNFTETKCRIGGFILNTSNQYDGLMDDIRIFDRALTTAEIKHLAKARGITGTPLKKGLGDEKLWLCPSIDDSAEDLSGNGNNGTYNGGMGTVADTSNGGTRAYSFDGSNDYVDFGDILDTEVWTAGDFAISGWIKTNGLNTVQVFNKYHNISGNRQFHFRVIYSGGNLKLNAYIHTTLNNAEYRFWEGSTSLNANTWYHVALNYDASASSNDRVSCFINGSSETMTVTQLSGTLSTIPDGSASLAIGARVSGASASDFRTGYSDDIRIFDRALTPTEITHLASARGVAGSPYGFEGLGDEKLWLCPTLDDSAEDISGNRNHGTYNGGMGTVADTSNGGTRAYSFDGINDYIDCDEVVVNSGISISLWMKRNEVSNFVSIVTKYDSSVGAGSPFSSYYVMSSVSGNGIRGYLGEASINSFKAEEYGSTVANNSWSHVAISCSLGSNKIDIFINGSFVTSSTLASSTFSSISSGSGIKTLIGARQNGSSVERFLNGYLDDIRVFDRALTQEEVTHLAKSRGVLGSPYNLNGIVHLLSSFIHPFT